MMVRQDVKYVIACAAAFHWHEVPSRHSSSVPLDVRWLVVWHIMTRREHKDVQSLGKVLFHDQGAGYMHVLLVKTHSSLRTATAVRMESLHFCEADDWDEVTYS